MIIFSILIVLYILMHNHKMKSLFHISYFIGECPEALNGEGFVKVTEKFRG